MFIKETQMASNDGIEKLIGTWEYVDGEHFDDFLSKIVRDFNFLLVTHVPYQTLGC